MTTPAQYDFRRDRIGWSVFDRWTGRVVILERAEQSALTFADARRLVQRLNRRRLDGDRSILQ